MAQSIVRERAKVMKKFLLTLVVLVGCTLPTFSEDNAMSTMEFARQTGELIGQARLCGIDTADANQRLIQGITVLANYRKESYDNAVQAYNSSILKQLDLPTSSYNCSQVRSDFAQVDAKLPQQKED